MAKAVTTSVEAGLKPTMLDVIGNIVQGSKIKRGKLFQDIVAEAAKKKYEEVLTEQNIKTITDNPEVLNRTGTHKVDVICLDHASKICDMLDSKSAATNHNESPGAVKAMMEGAIKGAEKRWSGYQVTYSFVRPGGDLEKSFRGLGIKSFDTSEYIGKDINKEVKSEYRKIVAEKTKDAVIKFQLTKREQTRVKRLVEELISTEL